MAFLKSPSNSDVTSSGVGILFILTQNNNSSEQYFLVIDYSSVHKLKHSSLSEHGGPNSVRATKLLNYIYSFYNSELLELSSPCSHSLQSLLHPLASYLEVHFAYFGVTLKDYFTSTTSRGRFTHVMSRTIRVATMENRPSENAATQVCS